MLDANIKDQLQELIKVQKRDALIAEWAVFSKDLRERLISLAKSGHESARFDFQFKDNKEKAQKLFEDLKLTVKNIEMNSAKGYLIDVYFI